MHHSQKFSSELLICRYQHGAKLIRPDTLRMKQHRNTLHPMMTLAEAMKLPFSVYFHDRDMIIKECNDSCWQHTGWNSKKDAINQTIGKVMIDMQTVAAITQNNNQVQQTESLHVFDEHASLRNAQDISGVSFKMPWFDDENQVVGTFGFTAFINDHISADVANQLAAINRYLLGTPIKPLNLLPGKKWDGIYFSAREMEVIHWIVRGKTIREIAGILSLSPRTVESYFATVKRKANVYTKSELIEKVLNDF